MKPGLYIHIPFCEQRCYYCAFTVAVTSGAAYAPYMQRLLREMELSGFRGEPATVYFGGGTPSLLPARMLEGVLKRVDGKPVETSIEVNPGTLSQEKVAIYRDLGINRVSLGAQSLEDEDLRRAGRLHRAGAVYADFELLRRNRFGNVSLDLIAGLPDQRMETWRNNLKNAVELRPEHISVYMLDQDDRSVWGKFPVASPDEGLQASFYIEAELLLEAAGYRHYEISNWALPGWECRHNLGYWSGIPYRGFGVGAHSFDGRRRFWNTDSLGDYARLIDSGSSAVVNGETLNIEQRLEEAFLLGLRQTAGVRVLEIAERLGIRYPDGWDLRVRQLQESGWIHVDGETLQLTPTGRLAANSVIGELLWPVPSSTFEVTP